jgi:hypothetical protein
LERFFQKIEQAELISTRISTVVFITKKLGVLQHNQGEDPPYPSVNVKPSLESLVLVAFRYAHFQLQALFMVKGFITFLHNNVS